MRGVYIGEPRLVGRSCRCSEWCWGVGELISYLALLLTASLLADLLIFLSVTKMSVMEMKVECRVFEPYRY